MYKEFKPLNLQDNWIDSFWMYSNSNMPETFKVYPDSHTDIIFDLNDPKAFVSGCMTNFQIREIASETSLLGIRIPTERFSQMSIVPLAEISNQRVALSHIIGYNSFDILRRFNQSNTTTDSIHLLEKFIAILINNSDKKEDTLAMSVAGKIRYSRGNVNIQNLAVSYGISLRQLERRFKRLMGLTIKDFSSIVRFNNAKSTISNSPNTSLLQIAFNTGFYDHAHMNHEFNRIAGENPMVFR